jgi:hypothetical protein
VVKRLVGGWQVTTASSNNPRTVLNWFDTTQFIVQAPFTLQYTSSAIANLRGPGIGMWNVDLSKEMLVNERVRFKLEAQAFNFLNTPFLGNPKTTVTSASFGQITGLYSGSGSRNVQISARIRF